MPQMERGRGCEDGAEGFEDAVLLALKVALKIANMCQEMQECSSRSWGNEREGRQFQISQPQNLDTFERFKATMFMIICKSNNLLCRK